MRPLFLLLLTIPAFILAKNPIFLLLLRVFGWKVLLDINPPPKINSHCLINYIDKKQKCQFINTNKKISTIITQTKTKCNNRVFHSIIFFIFLFLTFPHKKNIYKNILKWLFNSCAKKIIVHICAKIFIHTWCGNNSKVSIFRQ